VDTDRGFAEGGACVVLQHPSCSNTPPGRGLATARAVRAYRACRPDAGPVHEALRGLAAATRRGEPACAGTAGDIRVIDSLVLAGRVIYSGSVLCLSRDAQGALLEVSIARRVIVEAGPGAHASASARQGRGAMGYWEGTGHDTDM
jgi:hypothetical protein